MKKRENEQSPVDILASVPYHSYFSSPSISIVEVFIGRLHTKCQRMKASKSTIDHFGRRKLYRFKRLNREMEVSCWRGILESGKRNKRRKD